MSKKMRKVKTTRRPFGEKLERSLVDGFRQAGIHIQDSTVEPIRGTRLHRVLLISRGFKNLKPSERQSVAWRIIDANFKPEDQMRISMILALTPAEASGTLDN